MSATAGQQHHIIDLVGLLHDVGEVEGPLRFLWVNGVRGLSPGRHAAQSPAQGAAKFRRRRFLRRTKNTHRCRMNAEGVFWIQKAGLNSNGGKRSKSCTDPGPCLVF